MLNDEDVHFLSYHVFVHGVDVAHNPRRRSSNLDISRSVGGIGTDCYCNEKEGLMIKTSDVGVCRKCGVERTKGSHKKCDIWLARASGWHHIANNKTTTGKDLKKLAENIGDDTPIAFSVKLVWYAV
jgi:hypothetical protein